MFGFAALGLLDMGNEIYLIDPSTSERVGSEASPFFVIFPLDLFTDGGDGPNRRLRVDDGQTGFFAGREFRTFKELSLTLGQVYVVKAVVPVNIILWGLSLVLTSGEVKLYTAVGGTEGGAFSETLPILPRNTMSERPTPIYTPQVVLTAGGTLSGYTTIDTLWNKTADNANFASSVGVGESDERGVGANTYYFILTAVSASTGVFSARWEERP